MAHKRICRHAGGARAQVHLHRNQHHVRPELHLRQLHHLVILHELQVPKSKVCHPDMGIYILSFPTLNVSILMHMPRIASAIKILFQICWVMKEHPLVSTLFTAWKCSRHPLGRHEQPIERTWQQWWPLIQRTWIIGYYYYLQLADTLKNNLKDIFVSIIKEQCSNKRESSWRR